MNAGLLTERIVAKKSGRKPPQPPQPSPEPGFDRIELQAPFAWVRELDRVSTLMGMSRSAYIRMACTRQMAVDRRTLGESPADEA